VELREYWSIIRRRWWLPAAITLVALIASTAVGVRGATAAAQAVVTLSLVRVLRVLVAEIAQLETHIREQLALHPDGPIFRSLPRAGTVRAASAHIDRDAAVARQADETESGIGHDGHAGVGHERDGLAMLDALDDARRFLFLVVVVIAVGWLVDAEVREELSTMSGVLA